MREIKFRGRRTDTNEWVYGYYTVFIEGIRRNHCIIAENEDAKGLLESKQIKYYISIESVGEYTGLKDKNGKEIYEGDIIKDTLGILSRAEFGNGEFNFLTDEHEARKLLARKLFKLIDNGIKVREYTPEENKWWDCEVIGNIHENPELLKKKK